jgi:hypothetical protein
LDLINQGAQNYKEITDRDESVTWEEW